MGGNPQFLTNGIGRVAADALRNTRNAWPMLTLYQRFEQAVSLIVTALVSILVIAVLVQLTWRVASLVLFDVTEPSQQEVFQTVFGLIMTVLMALEFNHSILSVLQRHYGIVQVRTVLLIALLAMMRKFVIIDAEHAGGATLLGLAASVLALGAVYWLVREQDRRDADGDGSGPDRVS